MGAELAEGAWRVPVLLELAQLASSNTGKSTLRTPKLGGITVDDIAVQYVAGTQRWC